MIADDLFIATAARVAHKLTHIHFKRLCEPLKRAQRGNGLTVFDLGNVSAGHLHPSRQLPLAQVARTTDIAHLCRHLQTGLLGRCGLLHCDQLRGQWCGLLDIKRPATLSAQGVAGSVLHQTAVIAPHNFACIHADKSGGHDQSCGVPERVLRGVLHRDKCYSPASEP